MAKLLVIDNYDSFTYNLVQMFLPRRLEVEVHRADRITVAAVRSRAPDYILISPGPRDPARAGISTALIRALYRRVPILGVCLGMQCLNEVFGGRTVRAPAPVHGKTSRVTHEGRGLFAGLPSSFRAARYHSLATAPDPRRLADTLRITARSEDDVIMGLSHRRRPLHGVQFHPESFLTEYGRTIVDNFLRLGPADRETEVERALRVPA